MILIHTRITNLLRVDIYLILVSSNPFGMTSSTVRRFTTDSQESTNLWKIFDIYKYILLKTITSSYNGC